MTAFVADGAPTEIAKLSAGALIPSGEEPLPKPDPGRGVGGDQLTSELLPLDDLTDVVDVQNLTKAVEVGEQLAKQAQQAAAALAGQTVWPTVGTFTSGYGARWGVTHYGIDLANVIGTPIRAVQDGVVVESGPAAGFGLWVRIQHADGYISMYGHLNRTLVSKGQRVTAGEQIAEMGNRGYSTGPHLHFEVWDGQGNKLNPVPWLASRGVKV